MFRRLLDLVLVLVQGLAIFFGQSVRSGVPPKEGANFQFAQQATPGAGSRVAWVQARGRKSDPSSKHQSPTNHPSGLWLGRGSNLSPRPSRPPTAVGKGLKMGLAMRAWPLGLIITCPYMPILFCSLSSPTHTIHTMPFYSIPSIPLTTAIDFTNSRVSCPLRQNTTNKHDALS